MSTYAALNLVPVNPKSRALSVFGTILPFTFKVDGDEVVSYLSDQSGDYQEALARIQENMELTGPRNQILLVGKFENDNTVATLGLGDLQKTSEFGGQGGGNRGNDYEDEFLRSLQCEIECICEHTK